MLKVVLGWFSKVLGSFTTFYKILGGLVVLSGNLEILQLTVTHQPKSWPTSGLVPSAVCTVAASSTAKTPNSGPVSLYLGCYSIANVVLELQIPEYSAAQSGHDADLRVLLGHNWFVVVFIKCIVSLNTFCCNLKDMQYIT